MRNQELFTDGHGNCWQTIASALCLAAWCLTGGSQTGFSQGGHPDVRTSGAGPAFEVVSAKLTPKDVVGGSVLKYENGRLTMRKVGLIEIVSWAFNVKRSDMVVPGWAEEARGMPTYGIEAEADGPVPQDRAKLMLQKLLVERFQFAAHHEVREGVHQVLQVAKGGPKLKEVAAVVAGRHTVTNDGVNSRINCTGCSIDEFLGFLNVTGLGGPIYDRTGLSGRYDFTLDYGKYIEDSDAGHRLNALMAARIDAMRELGLKVVEARIPIDTFVVDHVEKIPSEN
ncbi:MAG: TIGR03435 family protein [Bryobacteraceae bacterium]|jgi:uncharacterized protein (TIGR03435 family)